MIFGRIWLVVALLPAAVAAQTSPFSTEGGSAAGAGIFASSDSEGFSTYRAATDYWRERPNLDTSFGMRYRQHQFQHNGWSRSGQQLAIVAKGELDKSGSNWIGEAGVLHQGHHQLFTLDGTLHKQFSTATSAEAFISREYVETKASLDRGIAATFVGASLEQGLGDHLTAVGLIGYQDFSDGNHRKHIRSRLIWQPFLDIGLTLQYRFRAFSSGESEIAGSYFNPDHYYENMLLVGWRKRGTGWTTNLLAGVGRQNVESTGQTPTALLEGSFEKQLTGNQSLSFRTGFNRSASFGGPDYRYRYVQANWIVKFN